VLVGEGVTAWSGCKPAQLVNVAPFGLADERGEHGRGYAKTSTKRKAMLNPIACAVGMAVLAAVGDVHR